MSRIERSPAPSAGGGGGAPTGPAGGDLAGEYPNPEVGSEKVVAGKIAAGAVTEAKLAAEAVTAGKLATGAVTEPKLGAEAVAAAKLKAEAVTEAKLASEAVSEGKLKANAVAKGKLSASVQEELEPKVVEHGFAIGSEVENKTYPGLFVKLGTHEEKKLIGVEYELLEGTSVELELQKANSGKSEAAAGITGYKVTELKAEKSVKRVASSKTLQDQDRITLKCTSATGAPKGLIATLFIESVK